MHSTELHEGRISRAASMTNVIDQRLRLTPAMPALGTKYAMIA